MFYTAVDAGIAARDAGIHVGALGTDTLKHAAITKDVADETLMLANNAFNSARKINRLLAESPELYLDRIVQAEALAAKANAVGIYTNNLYIGLNNVATIETNAGNADIEAAKWANVAYLDAPKSAGSEQSK